MWIYLVPTLLFLLFVLYHVVRRKLDSIRVKDIYKKYVVITGCDSGFGYATAKRLDSLGCHVIAGKIKGVLAEL